MRRFWLRAFAPLAVTGATLLVASGGLLAYLYLPAWNTLWTDRYGQILLIKVGLSVLVLFFGPRTTCGCTSDPTSTRICCRRPSFIEVGFALLVLAATGMLTSTAQPDMN